MFLFSNVIRQRISSRVPGDVIHLALHEKSYAGLHYSPIQLIVKSCRDVNQK